jgi:hypothetical protein
MEFLSGAPEAFGPIHQFVHINKYLHIALHITFNINNYNANVWSPIFFILEIFSNARALENS